MADARKRLDAMATRPIVGSPLKHDSAEKHVAGEALYIDDIAEPAGLAHACLGLSTIAHGKLLTLDLSVVEAAPGVLAVLTANDIPGENDISSTHKHDEPVFATSDILHHGQPLFAVHYLMAKRHWQIVNHKAVGKPDQGGIKTFTLKEAPKAVVETAVKAARCIGDGLYGVDLKETNDGVFVIEVNDNPNLDHGYEDTGEKDEVWVRLTQWFLDRLDRQGR